MCSSRTTNLFCRYYRRRPLTWVFFSVFLTITVIIVTSVTVRYTSSGGDSVDSTKLYSPTDTRIVPVNNALCQSLKMNVGAEGDSGYLATLYVLNAPPKLTGRETFTFNVQPSFSSSSDYQYYYFYLHPGSNFTVSACVTQASYPAKFYLFKGQQNFNRWQDDEYYTGYKDSFNVVSVCSLENKTKSYSIGNNDDYYYLVYESVYYTVNGLNVTATFHRTRYEVDNSSVVDSCSEFSGSYGAACSLGVALSGHSGYLAITPREDTIVDWTDGIDVDISCGARIWMYFIISLCALVGAVGIIATAIVVCVCVHKKRKQKNSTTTSTNDTVATAATTDAAPLISNPPPYSSPPPPTNPNYHPVPGGAYESNVDMVAPPPYKP